VASWLTDKRLESPDLFDSVKTINGLKAQLRRDIVFTHYPGDMNTYYGIVTNAVPTAVRRLPGERPYQPLPSEVLSSTGYSERLPGANL
jgi:hypothetical protein